MKVWDSSEMESTILPLLSARLQPSFLATSLRVFLLHTKIMNTKIPVRMLRISVGIQMYASPPIANERISIVHETPIKINKQKITCNLNQTFNSVRRAMIWFDHVMFLPPFNGKIEHCLRWNAGLMQSHDGQKEEYDINQNKNANRTVQVRRRRYIIYIRNSNRDFSLLFTITVDSLRSITFVKRLNNYR